ncbi:hypothetical protein FHS89_000090 [Rubricella aquisinus]|uniref:TraB/GumN family protein n=1 Tax=Rubricella aquisinus TaxID=2028108 RepID=A0A840WK97_9RHOB|nr:TraB/GumN family protein [Rubricella aquisinus]MBB5514092.1 hypothetical protein [Rubricella aquisinus]
MMRVVTLAFSFVIGISLGAAHAQEACTGTDLRAEIAPEVLDDLLMRVRDEPFGEGIAYEATRGADRITLFGTLHSAAPDVPALIAERVAGADLVFLESTLADQQALRADMQADTRNHLRPDGPPLSSELTADRWAILSEAAAALGMPSAAVDQFSPWFATLFLAVPACEINAQRQGRASLDQRLEAIALESGIPTRSLEDAQTALDVFSDQSEEDQLALLRQSIDGVADLNNSFITARNTWQEERPLLLFFLMEHVAAEDDTDTATPELLGQLDEGLLRDRNAAWLPRILEATDNADEIAVIAGALHLPRQTGLLQLLSDAGFTVTRLPLN